MTAHDLFKQSYYHYMGQFMGHLTDGQDNIKDYITKSFSESLEEYSIECAGGNCLILSYSPDKTKAGIERLQSIDVYDGYWLCHHDGHTGDWIFSHFIFKEEAIAEHKAWRKYMPKRQDWLWIVKVGQLI